MKDSRVVKIEAERDIIVARSACRDMARTLGFGLADQTRLTAAISELTRNVVQHGGGHGVCTVTDLSDGASIHMSVTVEDNGPGIPNVERAMEDGFSTGGGLGAGLPGARRLVHRFSIESQPGHTCVTVELIGKPWRR